MRGFLAWLGSLVVGGATAFVALTVFVGAPAAAQSTQSAQDAPDGSAWLAPVVCWLFALLIGLVLSAPSAFSDKDGGGGGGGGGGWSIPLPLPFFLMLLAFKAMATLGKAILYGSWWLIFLALRLLRGGSA